MRMTYDRVADAADIVLGDSSSVVEEYVPDIYTPGGTITLRFDADKRLVGIEVLGASVLLTADCISAAEQEQGA